MCNGTALGVDLFYSCKEADLGRWGAIIPSALARLKGLNTETTENIFK